MTLAQLSFIYSERPTAKNDNIDIYLKNYFKTSKSSHLSVLFFTVTSRDLQNEN